MEEKSIKALKKLMVGWNDLGDKYHEMYKEEIVDSGIRTIWSEKSRDYYKCAKLLRETLLKCGVDLEE